MTETKLSVVAGSRANFFGVRWLDTAFQSGGLTPSCCGVRRLDAALNDMGSWLTCQCGNLIHKNLFCGTGISIAVTEDFLNQECQNIPAQDLISQMILQMDWLLQCKTCGRLIILNEKENGKLEFYRKEDL